MYSEAKARLLRKIVVERPTTAPMTLARKNHFATLIKRIDSSITLLLIASPCLAA